jgi:myo-inositol 2-dehydrogenase/D-chiro-inositol 1-dehydrogenase
MYYLNMKGLKMKRINVGVIGAGRIGRLHAENLVKFIPDANVVCVADIMLNDEIEQWAKSLGIPKVTKDTDDIINNPDIQAVIICSSTKTHVDLIIKAAAAGKDIFCEKPIDTEVKRVNMALEAVEKAGVKFQIGFCRRYDHNFKSVHDIVASGKIGRPHIIKITTRDAEPPSLEYAKGSGGQHMDQMIHDFDMARFLSGSEVVEVSAFGNAIINPNLKEIDDVDISTVMLKMENGALCMIDNSRKSGFGYDLRAEVQCEEGCVQSFNDYNNTIQISTMDGVAKERPIWFFLERFQQAYCLELEEFIENLKNNCKPVCGAEDGLQSVLIAIAAKKSMDEGRIVKISELKQNN